VGEIEYLKDCIRKVEAMLAELKAEPQSFAIEMTSSSMSSHLDELREKLAEAERQERGEGA